MSLLDSHARLLSGSALALDDGNPLVRLDQFGWRNPINLFGQRRRTKHDSHELALGGVDFQCALRTVVSPVDSERAWRSDADGRTALELDPDG
jgi:hypothetical protein